MPTRLCSTCWSKPSSAAAGEKLQRNLARWPAALPNQAMRHKCPPDKAADVALKLLPHCRREPTRGTSQKGGNRCQTRRGRAGVFRCPGPVCCPRAHVPCLPSCRSTPIPGSCIGHARTQARVSADTHATTRTHTHTHGRTHTHTHTHTHAHKHTHTHEHKFLLPLALHLSLLTHSVSLSHTDTHICYYCYYTL